MNTYFKIQSLFKRDPEDDYKTFIPEFSTKEFEALKNSRSWRVTEKIDGTNIRVIWDGDKVFFAGKTDKTTIYPPLLEMLKEKFPAKIFDENDLDPMCIYGEGFGRNIQKVGGYYSKYPEFAAFDIKCGRWWLNPIDVEDICSKFDVDTVPLIIRDVDLYSAYSIVADGIVVSSFYGCAAMEGIVVRHYPYLFDRSGKMIIGKLKYKDFPDYFDDCEIRKLFTE